VSDLDGLLDGLPRWVLVGGKGGVGKTTCAAALASRSAGHGVPTLLLSTDPAGALTGLLGQSVRGVPTPVASRPELHALQLEATTAREAFLVRHRDTLITIMERGTYLDRDDIIGLVDAALPGADETMALLTLLELERDTRWRRIIVDTAPTGHTLRLLELPRAFEALVSLLDAMQDKHRFMVSALMHRYRADEADRFIASLRADLEALRRTIERPDRLAMVLVTRAELVVAAETARYAAALDTLHVSLGAIVINAIPPSRTPAAREGLSSLQSIAPAVPRLHVPRLAMPPDTLDAVDAWGVAVRGGAPAPLRPTAGARRMPGRATSRGGAIEALPVRPLTIVGGKGGVGKTSVACALGIRTASARCRVLVVSTDPAPSVHDALEQPVGDTAAPVSGVPGLFAQQLDAAAAFQRFRDAYSDRVDALFGELLGSAAESSYDRIIARELLSLAPPGIDELYALASLGEALEAARFDVVIVDPAPTGHLLRLLEMPPVAVAWSHQLLRLMLKYREVVGLGPAAQELLAFAKRTRALEAALHDAARAGLLLVALDEPLVRAETARLLEAVCALEIDVTAVIWNSITRCPLPLPSSIPLPQFASAACTPPPRGVHALRRWSLGWTPLAQSEHG
jgi:arsenite-transporting ATPase